MSTTNPAPDAPWWRDAVCYEIHPRAFADGDGDGVGDLAGAAARLDHVARLGADAVWITPFYPSPLADGGYDIADHTAVAPDLGTEADFDALVARAHGLGLRVLIDLVPNHTSDTHPWFREALAAGPGSAARHRYLFRTGRGADGELPRTTGSPRSGARRGPVSPHRTAARASGTCTCTRPSSRTSTGGTRRSSPTSSGSCGTGSTAASTASASTWPTPSSRLPASPTPGPGSTRTSCATT